MGEKKRDAPHDTGRARTHDHLSSPPPSRASSTATAAGAFLWPCDLCRVGKQARPSSCQRVTHSSTRRASCQSPGPARTPAATSSPRGPKHMYRQLERNSERARTFLSLRFRKKNKCPWASTRLGFGLVEILGIFAWLGQVVALQCGHHHAQLELQSWMQTDTGGTNSTMESNGCLPLPQCRHRQRQVQSRRAKGKAIAASNEKLG